MQQAARVSDLTAFFYMGNLIEYNRTQTMFTARLKRRPKTTSPAGLDNSCPFISTIFWKNSRPASPA